jgi:hypothetical protein
MNAKGAVTITAAGVPASRCPAWMEAVCLYPLSPGPYAVTVDAPSFSRMLSNATVVAGDRAQVDAQMLYCPGTVIAYVEAEGSGASGDPGG